MGEIKELLTLITLVLNAVKLALELRRLGAKDEKRKKPKRKKR